MNLKPKKFIILQKKNPVKHHTLHTFNVPGYFDRSMEQREMKDDERSKKLLKFELKIVSFINLYNK